MAGVLPRHVEGTYNGITIGNQARWVWGSVPANAERAEESMAYDLAIVLPTYNESGNVAPMVERLENTLANALPGIRYEVLFVDDDSPDGTAEVVRRLARGRDNLRVLRWIIDRCTGTAKARETAIGHLPHTEDLDTQGLNIAPGALAELLAVDPALWRTEFEGIATYINEFGARVPLALHTELADALQRVEPNA